VFIGVHLWFPILIRIFARGIVEKVCKKIVVTSGPIWRWALPTYTEERKAIASPKSGSIPIVQMYPKSRGAGEQGSRGENRFKFS
jgi:hypothetical protein